MEPTTIKAGTPSATCYGAADLENGAEIRALIDKVQKALRPCGRCGTQNGQVGYYYTPDVPAPHHFCIRCLAGDGFCQIQTPEDSALDTEKSIKETLQYLYTIWNRTPDDICPAWVFDD